MYIITPDQEYVLSVLQSTKVMRKDQAFRLLHKLDSGKTEDYVARSLGQLRHIRKVVWKTEDVFTLPLLYKDPLDEEMLSAIDVMLDLTDFKILAVSVGTNPFKFCFFTGQGNNLGSYAVIIVSPGSEAMITASLCGAGPEDRTVIFLLSELSQKASVKTALPHFFAVHDGSKYRYYKGVVQAHVSHEDIKK